MYDTTPSASPSGRIWGHYTSNPNTVVPCDGNVQDYAGSASGNYDYSAGTGWSYLEHTWTFDAGTDRTGMVIEARTYGDSGDKVWFDDLEVVVTTDSTSGFITTMDGTTTIPEPATMSLLGLGGIAALIRRRRRS